MFHVENNQHRTTATKLNPFNISVCLEADQAVNHNKAE